MHIKQSLNLLHSHVVKQFLFRLFTLNNNNITVKPDFTTDGDER